MNVLGHFKTITYHKFLVMCYCFRVGLIRQGLLHDMSKYSWTEFHVGAKYYSGTRSPNAAEREELGYSTAWLHHKGRNRHHLEYWIDYGGKDMTLVGHPMPTKYMVELCLDRIAACRVYHGKAYTDRDPIIYLEKSLDSKMMHPDTKKQVVEILTMLSEKGEKETLRYIRQVVLKNPVKCYPNLPPKAEDPGKKDPSFLQGQPLKALAQQLGTPFYLYDQAGIQKTCQQVREAFGWNKNYRQFFPVKATPTAGILKLLRENGQGVVCSSASELRLCQKCGFTKEEILFLPNDPREEDLEIAARVGCMPVLDGVNLIEDFERHGLLQGTVGLRITPTGSFRFGNKEVRTAGVKFGLTPEQLPETVRRLKSLGITRIGLHSYLSGNTLDPEYYPRLTALLLDLALELSGEIQVEYINISGGIGIAYEPEDTPPDILSLGKSVQAVFGEKLAGTGLEQLGLYTELGRFVTGPSGMLVTTVRHCKEGCGKFAGVDASAADLMRPMLYGAYHHISVAGKEGASQRENWDVVGAVCENTDKFAANRPLPPLEVGDVLAIHDAGAHGHSMGYNYGGRLRCGEYLWKADGTTELLRRPETISDYLSTQVF
jgi:diaminopimelate decarboxylase